MSLGQLEKPSSQLAPHPGTDHAASTRKRADYLSPPVMGEVGNARSKALGEIPLLFPKVVGFRSKRSI